MPRHEFQSGICVTKSYNVKNMANPTPYQITQARKDAGLTQTQSAQLIHKGLRTWQGWETAINGKGHRKMDVAFWELFNMKIALNAHK